MFESNHLNQPGIDTECKEDGHFTRPNFKKCITSNISYLNSDLLLNCVAGRLLKECRSEEQRSENQEKGRTGAPNILPERKPERRSVFGRSASGI